MSANQRNIIDKGCLYKEVKRLDEMKRRKRHALLIKAKEIELYITAICRIKRAFRKGA
jgi:hypothetical protein